MRNIKQRLRTLDNFAEPISLRFKGKNKFKTIFGALLSIFMFTLIMVFSSSKLSSFLYRQAKYIEAVEKNNFNPLPINLKHRFALTIGPEKFNSIKGKRFLDFLLILGIKENINGTSTIKKISLEFQKCNSSHFPEYSEDQLKLSIIENWICPNYNQDSDFFVQGKFMNDFYKYLQIMIMRCSSQLNEDTNDYCATQDEFDEIKKSAGKVYVSFIFVNNRIDLNDFDSPFSSFFDSMDFVIDTDNIYTQREIYFTSVELRTIETRSFSFLNGVFEGENVKENYIYEKKYDESRVYENVSSNQTKVLANLYLRSDTMSRHIVRKYDTFQDYLQTLGSLYSILYIFFMTVNRFFTHRILVKKIAKALYYFEDNQRRLVSGFSFLICFKHFLQKICFRNDEEKEVDFANLKFKDVQLEVNYDLDIIQILYNLKQTETIRHLLLTKDQNTLINLTSKPKFTERSSLFSKKKIQKKIDGKITRTRKKERTNLGRNFKSIKTVFFTNRSEKMFDEILEAFKKVLENDNEIDRKLIDLLDMDLIGKIRLKVEKKERRSVSVFKIEKRRKKKVFFKPNQPLKFLN